ncbi:MAG: polysaccharide biosynthesis protein [Planctomycetales bacterium]|nr:polysaccharide biosynthesis protein [Planctomycetales bacterium]
MLLSFWFFGNICTDDEMPLETMKEAYQVIRYEKNGKVVATINNASSRPEIWAPLPRIRDFLITIRVPLLAIVHTVIFATAYWLSFGLRFDFEIPAEMYQRFVTTLPFVLSIQIGSLLVFKSFHGWWRYVTLRDLISLIRPMLVGFAVITMFDYFVLTTRIPRAVLILDFLLSSVMIVAVRSSWRLAKEGLWPSVHLSAGCVPAFIISNRHETIIMANQINSRFGSRVRIVGILSDDKKKIGSQRAGIRILGTPENAPKLAREHGVQEVWIVAGDIQGQRISDLKVLYDQNGLSIKVIPPSLDLERDNGLIPVRDIEINDLLQRDPVKLDSQRIAAEIEGARVLVTGAGGSIGSEICRQLIQFKPSELVLVDHRENSVFLIHNELERLQHNGTQLHPAVGDILDKPRMLALFEQFRPEYVYHAAAHKHVGLMEVNPGEAIKNNILGTKNTADLARDYESKKFVLISTDKAVNPTSVMGCTKQIAERYVHAMAQENSDTAFVVVRFGNVLGSNGSVVPLFKEQIERGGPITVTDPRMTRFFMTIPEASQLVIQAASMGNGGEIFVLDMGEQIPIVDLARQMVTLSGLPPDTIEIRFVGARPGEKLYEELYFDDEKTLETDHPKIFAAYHRLYEPNELVATIKMLESVTSHSADAIREMLHKIVPEYQTTNEGFSVNDVRAP